MALSREEIDRIIDTVLGTARAQGYTSRGGNGPAPPPSKSAFEIACEKSRAFTAAELMAAQFPPLIIVVPDLIVEGLTLFSGKPKGGKSYLMMQVAKAVASGGFTLGNRHCIQGNVIYCALEDSPRRLRDRCLELSITGNDHILFVDKLPRLHEGALDVIKQEFLQRSKNVRLIVIDTLARVRPPKRAGAGAYEDDVEAVRGLHEFANDYRIAVALIHHNTKEVKDDPFDNVSGTNAITGMVDTIMVLKKESEGYGLYVKGREIKEIELAMSFNKQTGIWSVAEEDLATVQMASNRRVILDTLKDAKPDELSVPAVQNRTGLSKTLIYKTLQRMHADQQVTKAARGKWTV